MKDTKKIIAVLIALLILLAVDLSINIYHLINYGSQKASGNARWQQVEERIITVENKVKELEKKIENN